MIISWRPTVPHEVINRDLKTIGKNICTLIERGEWQKEIERERVSKLKSKSARATMPNPSGIASCCCRSCVPPFPLPLLPLDCNVVILIKSS